MSAEAWLAAAADHHWSALALLDPDWAAEVPVERRPQLWARGTANLKGWVLSHHGGTYAAVARALAAPIAQLRAVAAESQRRSHLRAEATRAARLRLEPHLDAWLAAARPHLFTHPGLDAMPYGCILQWDADARRVQLYSQPPVKLTECSDRRIYTAGHLFVTRDNLLDNLHHRLQVRERQLVPVLQAADHDPSNVWYRWSHDVLFDAHLWRLVADCAHATVRHRPKRARQEG